MSDADHTTADAVRDPPDREVEWEPGGAGEPRRTQAHLLGLRLPDAGRLLECGGAAGAGVLAR